MPIKMIIAGVIYLLICIPCILMMNNKRKRKNIRLKAITSVNTMQKQMGCRKRKNPECFEGNPGPQEIAENDCFTCKVQNQCFDPIKKWDWKEEIENFHRRVGEKELFFKKHFYECPTNPGQKNPFNKKDDK